MNFWKVSLLTSVLLLCVNVLSADATSVTFQEGVNGYSGNQATHIRQAAPNDNYDSYPAFTVEYEPPYETRSLIKFTGIFGTGENQIQVGSSIISATLRLNVNYSSGDTINTHLVTTSWDESDVTWKSFGVYTEDGGVAGDDWETPVISSIILPSDEFDIISAVSAWSSGTVNNGLILLGTTNATTYFCSEDESEEWRPLLIVEYEVPAVPEPLSIILLGLGLGINWFTKKFRNR